MQTKMNSSSVIWDFFEGLFQTSTESVTIFDINVTTVENNVTITERTVEYETRPEAYIIPFIFSIIFVVGVIGNGTLALIFFRHKVIRGQIPNILILSLAIGDLLVMIVALPFSGIIYTTPNWPFGELICKICEAAKDVSTGVSVFTLTALSADRFFAIVDPLKKLHSSGGGTKCTLTIVSIVWTLAVICAAPGAIFSYIRVFKERNVSVLETCYPYPLEFGPEYAKMMVLLKFLIYYAIPLTIIGFFYVVMSVHLIRSTRNMPGSRNYRATTQIQARKKVAVMVLAFVLVFAVCFIPQHIFMLWFYFTENAPQRYDQFWHIFRIVGFCLSFANSCMNPIALYCVSGVFRKYFDMYLFRFCINRSSRRRSSPSTVACSRTGTRNGRAVDYTGSTSVPMGTLRVNSTKNRVTTNLLDSNEANPNERESIL